MQVSVQKKSPTQPQPASASRCRDQVVDRVGPQLWVGSGSGLTVARRLQDSLQQPGGTERSSAGKRVGSFLYDMEKAAERR